jgi:alginate O-acetyltransferase complex protein AlgI
MAFSTSVFLFLFLPAVLFLYFLVPGKMKNMLLFIVSLFFYAWGEFFYAFLLLLSACANYGFGLWIGGTQKNDHVKIGLCLAILYNLGLLCWFKYANFIADSVNLLFLKSNKAPLIPHAVHLPIGISFFTFQALSYLIDVYRRDISACRKPLNVALYISLFPQLISGPIVRFQHIAAALNERSSHMSDVVEGIRRFIIGIGKKILLADTLGYTADAVFSLPDSQLAITLAWLGALSYTLQIYFDFSGYSDMAIGLGRIFGFRYHENFNYPYISQSITDFWRRWHISLSTWFRDYLYIPLGGNRCGTIRTYYNLVLTFLLCGLWHGANWTFIIWGLYHGFFLVVERITRGSSWLTLWRPFRHIAALAIIIIGWVIFRAETTHHAFVFLKTMFGVTQQQSYFSAWLYMDSKYLLAFTISIIAATPLCKTIVPQIRSLVTYLSLQVLSTRLDILISTGQVFILAIILFLSILQMSTASYTPFVYFRF